MTGRLPLLLLTLLLVSPLAAAAASTASSPPAVDAATVATLSEAARAQGAQAAATLADAARAVSAASRGPSPASAATPLSASTAKLAVAAATRAPASAGGATRAQASSAVASHTSPAATTPMRLSSTQRPRPTLPAATTSASSPGSGQASGPASGPAPTGRPASAPAAQAIDDDEDPPVSFPPVASSEESEWPPRDLRVSSSSSSSPDTADQGTDVRSNSPFGGGGGGGGLPSDVDADPVAEADPRPVTAPSPEDDARPGPAAWHLLNWKRCGLSKAALSDRIVGGAGAGLGQYPWLARIGYNLAGVPRRVFRCAGTVITHFHVLTAAHCVKNLPPNFEFAGVRLGEWDTSTDPDCQDSVCAPPVHDIDPETVIIHQDYNSPRFANDIALVKLAQRINFNGWVGPVCIPYGDLLTKSYELERTEVAGWGTYDITLQRSSQELRMVHLPVVSNSLCHGLYRNVADITKRQMCAGGEIGFDACSGDSGGPLVKVEAYSGVPRYYIVGIVSFGSKRCGLTPAPGVYTRVSYYIDWILNNIVQN